MTKAMGTMTSRRPTCS
ncbi:hypothetical protein HaLaN_32955, partial [Haematococcus lacustris]